MKALAYTLYKEHCDLYTKIHGSIAVNSCQIKLVQKDIILLSKAPIITYKTGKPTGVENRYLIYSTIPAGTYSIDAFNTKSRNLSLNQDKTGNYPNLKT